MPPPAAGPASRRRREGLTCRAGTGAKVSCGYRVLTAEVDDCDANTILDWGRETTINDAMLSNGSTRN